MNAIALVTGSSRGIGAATARLLAQQGYAVCINYHKQEAAALELQSELENNGVNTLCVQADVSDESAVVAMFEKIDTSLGRITALVNNAGILFPQMQLVEMSADRINKTLATNVTGAFLCCREAVKRMSTKNGGRGGAIVNVSSAASRIGAANEYIDYAASKGAMDTLTRGLSIEVANQGIRVNAVRPAFIDTDMHASGGEPDRLKRLQSQIPLGRGGKPSEVAEAIAWLLSDEASYSTGAMLDIAGGR